MLHHYQGCIPVRVPLCCIYVSGAFQPRHLFCYCLQVRMPYGFFSASASNSTILAEACLNHLQVRDRQSWLHAAAPCLHVVA